MNPFGDADRIGLIGDTHGELRFASAALRQLAERGVMCSVVAGDFGFVWGGDRVDLDSLSTLASELGHTLLFVDGNHEDFITLLGYEVGSDGVRWVAPSIGHLPRGSRFEVAGVRVAAMGGANSIDRWQRRPGYSWWPEESITEADLERLGSDPVDVLIGHDAPDPLSALDVYLMMTKSGWSIGALAYASEGRRQFTRAFKAVRPRLYVGGHYHHFVYQVIHVDDASGGFESRVLLLDMDMGTGRNVGILSLPSLEVEVFHV